MTEWHRSSGQKCQRAKSVGDVQAYKPFAVTLKHGIQQKELYKAQESKSFKPFQINLLGQKIILRKGQYKCHSSLYVLCLPQVTQLIVIVYICNTFIYSCINHQCRNMTYLLLFAFIYIVFALSCG